MSRIGVIEASKSLGISLNTTVGIMLYRREKKKTKVHIRLHGYVGRSASLLLANDIKRFSHDEAHFMWLSHTLHKQGLNLHKNGEKPNDQNLLRDRIPKEWEKQLESGIKFLFEPRHDKTCLQEFSTRPDTNRPAQPQKLARWLKFRL